MNDLKIFDNPEFGEIRTVERSGEAWFVGKDIALALGYSETAKAVRDHVSSDDRGVSEMDTPSGIQLMTIINESGLYSLIFSSKLPRAKAFKHWVTSEVLPAIRKTGKYGTAHTTDPKVAQAVSSLANASARIMRDKGNSPDQIAAVYAKHCRQFGVELPAEFFSEPKEKQQLMTLIEETKTTVVMEG